MKSVAIAVASPLIVAALIAIISLVNAVEEVPRYLQGAVEIAVVSAVILAVPGLNASRRGFRDGVGRKALAVIGVSINALIFVWGILVVVQQLLFLVNPGVRVSVAINGEPVRTAELFLKEKCDRMAATYSDRSTWCAEVTRGGRLVSSRGTFTIRDIDPGEYGLDVMIHPVPPGNCTSATSGIRLHTSTSSVFAPKVLIAESDISVQPGLGARTQVGIDLTCE